MKRLTLALLTAVPAAQLPDLIFERGNPNAFQTLQAALDAAQPGQRILMRSQAGTPYERTPATVYKSVTLEGELAGPEFVNGRWPSISLVALSPGIPLVIRRIEIVSQAAVDGVYRSIASPTSLAGAVVMEDVSISQQSFSMWTWEAGPIASIGCESLTMRRCVITALDTPPSGACCGYERRSHGMDALLFSGSTLYLEDCYITAGNAGVIRPASCVLGLCVEGGRGGTAVFAPNSNAVVVRSTARDGNGGSEEPGSTWPTPPIPGHPRPSIFNWVVGYAFQVQHGRSNAGGEGAWRGAWVRYGYSVAPLALAEARLGQPMLVTTELGTEVHPLAVAFSVSRTTARTTAYGIAHIALAPAPPIVPMAPPGWMNIHVPAVPELVNQPLVAQLIGFYNGFPFLSNPSVSYIGR